jgi:hypothetical protein
MPRWLDRLAVRAAAGTPTPGTSYLPGRNTIGNVPAGQTPGTGGSGPRAATQNVGWSTPGSPQQPHWDGRTAIDNAYYQSVWVMRGIQTIADTIASLPFTCGPDIMRPNVTTPGSRLGQLLGPANTLSAGGPNPTTSSRAFWAWSITQKAATGKMAWEIQTDPATKQIVSLWPLVAFLLQPLPSPGGPSYWSSYQYQLPTGPKNLSVDQVFYAWKPSQRDWREPESLLESAGLAISISVAFERHMWNLLKNGMVAAHMVSSLPIDDSDQRRAWEESFMNQYTGFDNAGKPVFNYGENDDGTVRDTVQITPLATTPIDGQLLQLADWAKNETLVSLGVPESLIGNASQRIYANADAEYRNFWTTRALGVVSELQDDINTNLAPKLGGDVGWFDLSRVVALQPPQAFAPPALTDMLAAGVISVQDAQDVLGVGQSGDIDSSTAPTGEEAPNPNQGARTTTTLMETRTVRLPDGRHGVLDRGDRLVRTAANTHTYRDGTAWQWRLERAPRPHITIRAERPTGLVESPGAVAILERVTELREERTLRVTVREIATNPEQFLPVG